MCEIWSHFILADVANTTEVQQPFQYRHHLQYFTFSLLCLLKMAMRLIVCRFSTNDLAYV